MRWTDSLALATRSLRRRLVRAALTGLGVALGSALLVALGTISSAADTNVIGRLNHGGPIAAVKVAAARPQPDQLDSDTFKSGAIHLLDDAAISAIRRSTHVSSVVPVMTSEVLAIPAHGELFFGSMVGTDLARSGDLPLTVTPFLNVTSGDARIRVEHGHLHEPFYARHPGLYELGGRVASGFLVANADTYKIWAQMQKLVDRRRRVDPAASYPHYAAASTLFERGFDAVVFGHTHHPERTLLPDGLFVNAGDWMTTGSYAVIDHGAVELHAWTP